MAKKRKIKNLSDQRLSYRMGSERQKQISYINTYMWNLEKWCGQTYLQSKNRNTDVENKRMDTMEGRGWDKLGDWG